MGGGGGGGGGRGAVLIGSWDVHGVMIRGSGMQQDLCKTQPCDDHQRMDFRTALDSLQPSFQAQSARLDRQLALVEKL